VLPHRSESAPRDSSDCSATGQARRQEVAQQVDAACHLCAHGAGRSFESLGDLLGLESMFEPEPQHRAVDLGQPRDRQREFVLQLPGGHFAMHIDDHLTAQSQRIRSAVASTSIST